MNQRRIRACNFHSNDKRDGRCALPSVARTGPANRARQFSPRLLDDVVNAAPRHRRQIFSVRIARTVLHRARNAHVPFCFAKPGCNFRVIDGGQFSPNPSRSAALKSMSPNRADERPQKFALPPVPLQRFQYQSVPGAFEYATSCSKCRWPRCTPTPRPNTAPDAAYLRVALDFRIRGISNRRLAGAACNLSPARSAGRN